MTLLSFLLLALILLNPDRLIGSQELFEQGLFHLESKRYEEAEKTFSKAIVLKPDDAEAFCNRGVVWFYRSEYDRAIADFTKALELDSNYALAYCNRGILWTEKAEYDHERQCAVYILEIVIF